MLFSEEYPSRALEKDHPYLDHYLSYVELKRQKLAELQAYHAGTFKLSLQDVYLRQGTLLKKGKNGQYRERMFQLMMDSLTYAKYDKNDKEERKSVLPLYSMTIEKPKDQKHLFF